MPPHLARREIAAPGLLVFLAASLSPIVAAAPIVREVAPVVLVLPPGPEPPRPVFPTDRLQEMLQPLVGSSCDPQVAADRIARRYRFLGYVPSVEASCKDGVLRVQVRESSHTVDLITCEADDLARIGAGPGGPPTHLYPVPTDAPRAVLTGLVRTRPGDLYNHARYRRDREALLRFGYTIAFVPGEPSDRGWRRGAYLIQALAPQPRDAGADTSDKNYVGGNAAYGPAHGGSIGFLYQRDELFGRYDRLSIAPSYNAAIGGSLSYRAPLLARRAFPVRLYELEIGVFSNFVHDRLLLGVRTDERRTGGAMSLGVRPLHRTGPHALTFTVGLRHERTDLDPPPPGEAAEVLTTIRPGLGWEWRHDDRWPHFAWRVDPAIDFAFDAAGGSRAFVRPSIDSIFHTRHLSGLETDMHLFAGSIDRSVPSYELWSLGGGRSVRGFEEDYRLGRNVAALQAELWIPILPDPEAAAARAPSTPDAVPYSPPVARLFKAAVFVDGGLVSGTPDGLNDAIAGAGAGLRILFPRQPLIIRLDYGWGLGSPGSDGHFYAGINYGF